MGHHWETVVIVNDYPDSKFEVIECGRCGTRLTMFRYEARDWLRTQYQHNDCDQVIALRVHEQ